MGEGKRMSGRGEEDEKKKREEGRLIRRKGIRIRGGRKRRLRGEERG